MPADTIIDLGLEDYEVTWKRMKDLRLRRKAGEIPDTLLLVEHPAVITVGVQGAEESEFPPGIPAYHVERGGKATYHGPGQQVGYPIVDLNARGRDVRRFVHDLEEMVARSVEPFGIQARRVEGKRGVWVGERKIASVGIAVQDWVTYHGFALNVQTDLSKFEAFHPCGFEGKIMTSISHEIGRGVTLEEVRPGLDEAWRALFKAPVAASSADPPTLDRIEA